MDIPLVQYMCDKCGNLTEVMDCDQKLPNGWTYGEGRHTHFCPKCTKKIMKRCKSCDWLDFYWKTNTKKQFYCRWKLQQERQKSNGDEYNANVKTNNEACEYYNEKF